MLELNLDSVVNLFMEEYKSLLSRVREEEDTIGSDDEPQACVRPGGKAGDMVFAGPVLSSFSEQFKKNMSSTVDNAVRAKNKMKVNKLSKGDTMRKRRKLFSENAQTNQDGDDAKKKADDEYRINHNKHMAAATTAIIPISPSLMFSLRARNLDGKALSASIVST